MAKRRNADRWQGVPSPEARPKLAPQDKPGTKEQYAGECPHLTAACLPTCQYLGGWRKLIAAPTGARLTNGVIDAQTQQGAATSNTDSRQLDLSVLYRGPAQGPPKGT